MSEVVNVHFLQLHLECGPSSLRHYALWESRVTFEIQRENEYMEQIADICGFPDNLTAGPSCPW